MKKITPVKRKDEAKKLVLFQTRVDAKLYFLLRRKLLDEGVYIQDFMDAAMKAYLGQE